MGNFGSAPLLLFACSRVQISLPLFSSSCSSASPPFAAVSCFSEQEDDDDSDDELGLHALP